MPSKCADKMCERQAAFHVCLKFRRFKGDKMVRATTGVGVCGLHREVSVNDVIPTDDLWAKIVAHFPSGWAPDRDLTIVYTTPM